MYVFVVYSLCTHLSNLWIDTCALLLVGVARAFGTIGPCATKYEQCEDSKTWEVLSTLLKARIWSFLKTATCFFASLAPTPLFRSHRSRRRLHRVVAAFWLSVFTSVFTPVFQLLLSSQFSAILTSQQWDCKHATALETINLHNCTQLFVNRTFNCIPKQDRCLHTNCISKRGRSWGHTPPTKNTLCKINLVLRHSAIVHYVYFHNFLFTISGVLSSTHRLQLNEIGNSGAAALADALRVNQSLTTLK